MNFNFNLLRAIGILLVTNSHFDLLYPDPRLSSGGALGNSIFFALSGYGLAQSFHSRGQKFVNWYSRRITRIFPSVWIVALLSLTYFGLWQQSTLTTLFAEFIWPTRHWFISAIMIFYVVFFILLVTSRKFAFEASVLFLLIPYFIGYFWFIDLSIWSIEGGYFKWIFYGQLMLLGAVFSNRDKLLRGVNFRYEIGALATLFVGYFLAKSFLAATGLWYLQFFVHLITLPLLLLAFRITASEPMQAWVAGSRTGIGVTFISTISFEIYLTQHFFNNNQWLISLPFPFGAMLAFVGISLLSIGVFWLSNFLRSVFIYRTGGVATLIPESRQ